MYQRKTIGLVLPGPIKYSETFFTSKINGLQEAGFEVVIFCPKGDANEKYKYIYQWTLSSSTILRVFQVVLGLLKVLFKTPKRFINYIKLNRAYNKSYLQISQTFYTNGNILTYPKIDFLHFGFATMGVNRELLGKTMKCKLSTSVRGFDIAITPLKHGKNYYALLWQQIHKLHTISNDLLALAYKRGLSEYTSVKKISPAIDVASFSNPGRRDFFKNEHVNILTVGRLHWKKGFEYSLMAMQLLKDAGIAFTYTIVGTGKDQERLSFSCYQMGLDSEVKFLGKLPHEEIATLMWKHDIYLQPSVQEGFCNAVLEAQAAGMLCIVSNAEGLPENVLDEKTGWVVPVRSPKAIAQKIIEVSKMPIETLNQISQNAIERVTREFNLNNYIKAFIEFYED